MHLSQEDCSQSKHVCATSCRTAPALSQPLQNPTPVIETESRLVPSSCTRLWMEARFLDTGLNGPRRWFPCWLPFSLPSTNSKQFLTIRFTREEKGSSREHLVTVKAVKVSTLVRRGGRRQVREARPASSSTIRYDMELQFVWSISRMQNEANPRRFESWSRGPKNSLKESLVQNGASTAPNLEETVGRSSGFGKTSFLNLQETSATRQSSLVASRARICARMSAGTSKRIPHLDFVP